MTAPAPPPPLRRIILHCGAQKTGSTSLQHYLGNQADLLAREGIGLPQRLVSKRRLDPLHRILVRSRFADTRADAIAEARERVARLFETPGIDTLLISNESLLGEPVRSSSRQFFPLATEALDALQQVFRDYQVDVRYVVRDLPSFFSSYYVQYVRRGGQRTFPNFLEFLDPGTITWMAAVDPLVEVFGAERLQVFDHADLIAQPDAFLTALLDDDLGFPHPPFDPRLYAMNRSFGGALLAFAMRSNRVIGKLSSPPSYPRWIKARNALLKPLSRFAGGGRPQLPEDTRQRFHARFEQDRSALLERGLLVEVSGGQR